MVLSKRDQVERCAVRHFLKILPIPGAGPALSLRCVGFRSVFGSRQIVRSDSP